MHARQYFLGMKLTPNCLNKLDANEAGLEVDYMLVVGPDGSKG